MPGFIDLQINGAYGIDVMSATPEELLEISRRLPIEGTTAWLPTVITAPFERIERAARAIDEAMAEQCERRRAITAGSRTECEAAILGIHLEGPFISARRGSPSSSESYASGRTVTTSHGAENVKAGYDRARA